MTQQTTVVVNPDPVFSITNTTPAICEGTAAGITLTTPTTGGVIRVTAVDYGTATGGTVAVNDTYTDGQKIVETLGNPGDAAITVTYEFEVSASGCTNPTRQQTTITLHPDPVFSITNATPSICEGTGVDITLNTPTEDGLIELLSVDYNGATDGTYSGGEQFGNGDKITETLTNPGDAPITVTYTF